MRKKQFKNRWHTGRNPKECLSAIWLEKENCIIVTISIASKWNPSCRIDKRAIEGWLKRVKGKKMKPHEKRACKESTKAEKVKK